MGLQEDLAALNQRNNIRSSGLLERYGPKPIEVECSTSLNDSEQMANDLDVKDWDAVDTDGWRPEGEENDEWRPKDAPVAASPISLKPVGMGDSGLFSKGAEAPPKQHRELEVVSYLTDAILAHHTRNVDEQRTFQSNIQQWREGAGMTNQKNGVPPPAPAQALGNEGGGRWTANAKMAGLHGEDQAPEDEAERAAQGRVLFRPVQGAPALPSGRPGRAGGGIFQSARRAISIRRDLSMRSHGHGRMRPQTVRVAAPLKASNPNLDVAQTRAQKEEAARESEKLAREAARRAARRAAARAAALNAAKQAEEDAARAAREAEQEQADADAQRVAQVARRAAVAREAAQAARRKRQPIFNVDEKDKLEKTRPSRLPKSPGTTSQPSSRPASQRTNTQSPRTQRSVTAAASEKGSTRSSPSPHAASRRKRMANSERGGSRLRTHEAHSATQSHRPASSPEPMQRRDGRHSSAATPAAAAAATQQQQHAAASSSSQPKSASTSTTATSADATPTGAPCPPPPLPLGGAPTAPPPMPLAPAAAVSGVPPVPLAAAPLAAATLASAPVAAATGNSSSTLASPAPLSTPTKGGGGHMAGDQRVYLPAQRLNVSAVTAEANGAPTGGTGGKSGAAKAGGRKPGAMMGGGVSSPIAAS